jgi:macrolide transport system ATP-binding/permease protein
VKGLSTVAKIELKAIRKDYELGKLVLPVLKGVSLSIEAGEMVALMGASGSGKTTLINVLGCLDLPTEGSYQLDGQEVSALSAAERATLRNEQIGFVFQSFNLLPRLSALENVMMPMSYARHHESERVTRDRARALLERVGLGDRLHHEPTQLSGGEQQRVAIARALVNRAPVLIADEPTGNLDSKTGEEILALFRDLNERDGLTILVVTHDPIVANHADRTIRISDGLIADDPGPNRRPRPRSSPEDGFAEPRESPLEGVRDAVRSAIRPTTSALRSLRRNVPRSLLTTLGIIIGVGSIIAIAEVGQGSATAIKSVLETTGVNNLLVQAGAASRNGVSLGSGTIKTLTPEDAEAIDHECPAVDSLAPIVYARRQVVHGSRNWVPIYVYGTTPSFLRVRQWEDLDEGEPFTERDVRDVGQVCLLGRTIVKELFDEGESPIGKEVIVNDVPLRVLGVLSRKGTNIIGIDEDDILLAPWTTIKFRVSASSSPSATRDEAAVDASSADAAFRRRYPRAQVGLYPGRSETQALDAPKLERFANVDAILVRATDTDEIPIAVEQIRGLLHERHVPGPDGADDFDVKDFTEVIHAVESTVGLVAGLLICVALISLMVGGVGIMNIMLVTVTERIREIGLRMAVGASPGDILRQFLVEAVVLCVLGGAVGIAVGRGGSLLVRILARWPTETSLVAILASVSVSITVGIIFGYYPAWKASRLNPIEALRHE